MSTANATLLSSPEFSPREEQACDAYVGWVFVGGGMINTVDDESKKAVRDGSSRNFRVFRGSVGVGLGRCARVSSG